MSGCSFKENALKLVFAIVLAVVVANPAVANWSEEQTAVWSVVEQSWVDDAEETGEWPTGFVAEGYSSWGETDALPSNLAQSNASVRFGDESSTTRFYQVKPVTISINGDTAVVNYYSTVVSENNEGEREREVSAITETLVRRDGAWLFLGSSGWTPDLN
jgi:hypothetical protein